MTKELDSTINFLKLIHDFQNVERMIPVCKHTRLENDAEHSYSLAMVAWYMIESFNLNLNKERALKYALAHDIVEVHAGDTYVFDTDTEKHASKHEREQKALVKLQKDFPKFPSLAKHIEQYETRNDDESKFIYALDKLMPVLTIYLASKSQKSFWQKHKITFEALIEMKNKKIATSPIVNSLWQEFKSILEEEQEELFFNA